MAFGPRPDTPYMTIAPKVMLLDLVFIMVLYTAYAAQLAVLGGFVAAFYVFTILVTAFVSFTPLHFTGGVPSWHFEFQAEKYSRPLYKLYNFGTEILFLYLLYLNGFTVCIGLWVISNALAAVYRKRPAQILEYRKNDPTFREPQDTDRGAGSEEETS